MTRRRATRVVCVLVAVLSAVTLRSWQATSWLTPVDHLVNGVDYFRSTDPSLVDPPSPIAVFLLRLDRSRVRLASVHARDEIMGLETVDGIATRHHAVAAINGGFFNTTNGDPQFVLKE